MSVLVTGATSPLAHLIRRRLPDSRVVGFSRRHVGGWPTRDLRLGDIRDERAVRGVLAEISPRAIVHLAAVTGAECEQRPDLAFAVNVSATARMLDGALEHGVRAIVFASTAAVYGTAYSGPADERARLDVRTAYASTKRAAEVMMEAASLAGMSTRVIRIFNMWGDGLPDSLVERLSRATADHPAAVRSAHGFVRDYVHVADVADAVVATLDESLRTTHLVVNVGSGVPLSTSDLIARLDIDEARYAVEDGEGSYSCADISLARELLRFDPSRLPGA